jgi:hypothetical protein
MIEYIPEIFLLHQLVIFFQLCNFGLEITSVGIFHNNAERLRNLLKEGVFVGDYIRMLNRSQDPDFI